MGFDLLLPVRALSRPHLYLQVFRPATWWDVQAGSSLHPFTRMSPSFAPSVPVLIHLACTLAAFLRVGLCPEGRFGGLPRFLPQPPLCPRRALGGRGPLPLVLPAPLQPSAQVLAITVDTGGRGGGGDPPSGDICILQGVLVGTAQCSACAASSHGHCGIGPACSQCVVEDSGHVPNLSETMLLCLIRHWYCCLGWRSRESVEQNNSCSLICS